MNEQLEAATEALRKSEERAVAGQLALELMHEIKNPLEALGHLTYLACEEAADADKVRLYMGQAAEQMNTLTHIVGQTLGFTRSSGTPRTINLVELAEAGLRIHQRRIDERKIRLVKELPDGISAEVHTGEILQVISNLIVNAVDALPDQGMLRLRLRRRGDRIELVVADNGHGIPSEAAERVFEPFFTTKGDHGSGLGLALSKRIMDRHKGRIRMRSRVTPGKSGTVFRISLPG
ncbi:MAG: HAMP domain-containing sensor histidine kinase [Granulicella sp.]